MRREVITGKALCDQDSGWFPSARRQAEIHQSGECSAMKCLYVSRDRVFLDVGVDKLNRRVEPA